MIAKTRAALLFMLEELQSNHIEKWYRAQVYPSLKESSGSIRAPLLRIENAKNENKVRVDPT